MVSSKKVTKKLHANNTTSFIAVFSNVYINLRLRSRKI